MSWYIEVLKKYAVFNGRARRKEYWMFILISTAITFALGFINAFIGGLHNLGIIYYLAVIIPSSAVGVRRMHDTGRSGWWMLLPIINWVFMFFDSQAGDNQFGPNPKEADETDEYNDLI